MKVKQVILAGVIAGLIAAAFLLPVLPSLAGLFGRAGDLGFWGPAALAGIC